MATLTRQRLVRKRVKTPILQIVPQDTGAPALQDRIVDIKRQMDMAPDPGAGVNQYPNPPWNTVRYDWNQTYPEGSPEYYAQVTAKFALVTGLTYSGEEFHVARRELISGKRASMHLDAPAREPDTAPPITKVQEYREPLQVEQNGVMTDKGLVLIRQGRPVRALLTQPVHHIGDIMQLCIDHDLRSIWILAGTDLSGRATRDFVEAASDTWDIRRASYTEGPEGHIPHCKYVMGWKRKECRTDTDDGRECAVGFAEHNDRWDFDDISNPSLLLTTLAYLEDAIGIPVAFSPATVGRRMMYRTNEGERADWIQPVKGLIDIEPIVNTGASDLSWKRPLTDQELAHKVLVAYDKNSQYPASCTSALLGTGAPIHVNRPQFNMKRLIPGVWRVRISGDSSFNGVDLPHPTDGVLEGWFWSYTVRLCIELGYTVEVLEAWLWNTGHTILRPWAEELWRARTALKTDTDRYPNAQAREKAYSGVKYIANHAIGLLARQPGNPDLERAYDLYRPDWRALIVDNARYRMFWRIKKFLDLGYRPVGVFVDCLYYTSDDNNPETAVPGFLDRAGMLGGYKVKYDHVETFPVSLVAPWFADEHMDMAAINQQLNRLNREAVLRRKDE